MGWAGVRGVGRAEGEEEEDDDEDESRGDGMGPTARCLPTYRGPESRPLLLATATFQQRFARLFVQLFHSFGATKRDLGEG